MCVNEIVSETLEMLLESTPEEDVEKLAYIHRKLGSNSNKNLEFNKIVLHLMMIYWLKSIATCL